MAATTVTKYSRAIRILHWVLALLLIGLLIAGTIMHNTADEATKFAILKLHAPLGLLAGILLFARTYFAFTQPRPAADPNWSLAVKWGSKIIHILLYVFPHALVGSGIATMVASGLGEILQSGQTAPWPELSGIAFAGAHGLFAKLFLASLVLHIAGAIYHQAIIKDNLIARMMPGK
ncbi:cytochrome b [Maritalea porphyrae]|uniref:cytochrome b n=1 Tax=Maritalea porphyrae TaxID=880732 RepID=UPI0022AEA26E|nr:cytochrome b/b6 domain-containing protein [Maritalea porphyrae]MCZ4273739.1 cytochrome b/b6 domain-containing protein [Maritalea porphyrae]